MENPVNFSPYKLLLFLSLLFLTACAMQSSKPTQPVTTSSPNTSVNQGTAQPVVGPITYVALGDSTGVGVGARNGGYVVRLFNELQKHRSDSKLTNLCVSGATSTDVVRNQLDRGINAHPQLVTIGIGINDIGHGLTLEQFAANLDQILTRLQRETSATIVVSNIPDVSQAPRIPQAVREQSQAIITQYNERLQQIAAAHQVTVFDVFSITRAELAKHPEYFSNDGFHPSDAGYELWAKEMWPTVAEALSI
jgi:acyl-CoA thioesterase I